MLGIKSCQTELKSRALKWRRQDEKRGGGFIPSPLTYSLDLPADRTCLLGVFARPKWAVTQSHLLLENARVTLLGGREDARVRNVLIMSDFGDGSHGAVVVLLVSYRM